MALTAISDGMWKDPLLDDSDGVMLFRESVCMLSDETEDIRRVATATSTLSSFRYSSEGE